MLKCVKLNIENAKTRKSNNLSVNRELPGGARQSTINYELALEQPAEDFINEVV